MNHTINAAVSTYFEALIQYNLLDKDIKSIKKSGNVIQLEHAHLNKLFMATIKQKQI